MLKGENVQLAVKAGNEGHRSFLASQYRPRVLKATRFHFFVSLPRAVQKAVRAFNFVSILFLFSKFEDYEKVNTDEVVSVCMSVHRRRLLGYY